MLFLGQSRINLCPFFKLPHTGHLGCCLGFFPVLVAGKTSVKSISINVQPTAIGDLKVRMVVLEGW